METSEVLLCNPELVILALVLVFIAKAFLGDE